MGPGTSSDVLVIFYIVIAAILAIVAAGFVLHRRGRLAGRRAGLSFALLCVLPILVGIVWYVWNVP
jgi:heme/copper-type cytochrome/quinol oxidase subunit 4